MNSILSILFILSTLSCSALELSAPSSLIESLKSTVTLAWNPDPGVDGFVILGGISSGNYIRYWDVGTNEQITLNGLPGGFTWYFVAEAYRLYLPETNRMHHIEAVSAPSSEVSTNLPCPPGDPQLLVTNNVWIVMAQGGGNLQSSGDLVTWTTLGPAPTNAPIPYAGIITNRQFFRIHP